jgi:hypothetical protein
MLFHCALFVHCTVPLFSQTTHTAKPALPSGKNLFQNVSVSFSAGMGVSLISLPDIADYINSNNPEERADEFRGVPDFFSSVEIFLTTSLGAKLEYEYMFTSYNALQNDFSRNENIEWHMPTLIVQQLFPSDYSILKLGAGVGYHWGKVKETYYGFSTEYLSYGIGVKCELEGNTALSEHLFAYFVADVRINFYGTLRSREGRTMNIKYKEWDNSIIYRAATLNFFSLGFKLGVILYT